MADNEVATRAPESDAHDDNREEDSREGAATPKPAAASIFPGDTRAQDGLSMGVS